MRLDHAIERNIAPRRNGLWNRKPDPVAADYEVTPRRRPELLARAIPIDILGAGIEKVAQREIGQAFISREDRPVAGELVGIV